MACIYVLVFVCCTIQAVVPEYIHMYPYMFIKENCYPNSKKAEPIFSYLHFAFERYMQEKASTKQFPSHKCATLQGGGHSDERANSVNCCAT